MTLDNAVNLLLDATGGCLSTDQVTTSYLSLVLGMADMDSCISSQDKKPDEAKQERYNQMINELLDEGGYDEETTAIMLGELGYSKAGHRLIKVLLNKDSLNRTEAAEWLGRQKYIEGIEALFLVLRDKTDEPPVRLAALLALGHIVVFLSETGSDDNEQLSEAAKIALDQIFNKERKDYSIGCISYNAL